MPRTSPAPALPQPSAADVAPIWVIMPLKDGGLALRGALDSLLADLECVPGARVVLVDDGSADPETLALLTHAAARQDVRVVRSTRQLGFTAAVNLGLRHIGRGPVLLLNSDVRVPRHSISRLLAHLGEDDIGTVTPLSNNAGSFCLLGQGKPFPMPSPQMCEDLAAAAYAANTKIAVDVPNGNGFAMLISEPCLRAIGSLSGVYDSGYYEEVDFCLRAAMRGWRSVAATDCFIGHVGSVTYGAQKQQLVAANLRRLLQRFPAYAQTYAAFDALDPLLVSRTRILQAVAVGAFAPSDAPTAAPPIAITLPPQPTAPVLLPCTDAVSSAMFKRQFRSLRLCRQASLSAAGLTVDPGHQLYLTPAGNTGDVSLYDAAGTTPILHFQSADADDADFDTFETTVLTFHGQLQASGAAHALPV
jgi:GT2 family glycosyltransferase